MDPAHTAQLSATLAGSPLPERLQALAAAFPAVQTVFTTSFGQEDQVLAHAIAQLGLGWRVATLDTGRLFPETYEVWDQTATRYKLAIEAWYPDADALRSFVTTQGPNSFYESVDNRLACCRIRKVEPLCRLLQGAALWVTGLRAQQSAQRADLPTLEWDSAHGLAKANPLFDWTQAQVLDYLATHRVPQNALHALGFPSIGCAPCTRAVQPGEDPRAGRWWWEQSHKECGLHLKT
jgi:phosphoadenosine phosphosulfate reductase